MSAKVEMKEIEMWAYQSRDGEEFLHQHRLPAFPLDVDERQMKFYNSEYVTHLEDRLKEAEKVVAMINNYDCGCTPHCHCFTDSAKLIKLEVLSDEAKAYMEKYNVGE